MNTRKLIASGLAGVAGITVIGIGVSAAQSDDASAATTPTTVLAAADADVGQSVPAGQVGQAGQAPDGAQAGQPGPGGQMGGPRGGLGGPGGLTNLADALGIDEATLQTAMESVRSETAPPADATQSGPPAAPTAEEVTARDTKLAAALNISVDELNAAQAQAMTTQLQDMVTNNLLTQAQADEVKALLTDGDTAEARTKLHEIMDAARPDMGTPPDGAAGGAMPGGAMPGAAGGATSGGVTPTTAAN